MSVRATQHKFSCQGPRRRAPARGGRRGSPPCRRRPGSSRRGGRALPRRPRRARAGLRRAGRPGVALVRGDGCERAGVEVRRHAGGGDLVRGRARDRARVRAGRRERRLGLEHRREPDVRARRPARPRRARRCRRTARPRSRPRRPVGAHGGGEPLEARPHRLGDAAAALVHVGDERVDPKRAADDEALRAGRAGVAHLADERRLVGAAAEQHPRAARAGLVQRRGTPPALPGYWSFRMPGSSAASRAAPATTSSA